MADEAPEPTALWKKALTTIASGGVVIDSPALDEALESAKKSAKDKGSLAAEVLQGLGLDADTAKVIGAMTPDWPVFNLIFDALWAAVLSVLGIVYTAKAGFATVQAKMDQKVYPQTRPFVLTPADLLAVYHRVPPPGTDFQALFTESVGLAGLNEKYTNALVEAARQLVPPNDALQAYVRGFILKDDLTARLLEHGFHDADHERMIDLALRWPDPQMLLQLERRGLTDGLDIERIKKAWGYDENLREAVYKARLTMPDMETTFELYRRGWIDETLADTIAETWGFGPELTKAVKLLWYQIPDVQTTMELVRRKKLDVDVAGKIADSWGYAPSVRTAITELQYRLLDFEQIRTLYWRGALSASEVGERLQKLGVHEDDLKHYTTLWNPTDPYTGNVPPFQDIIRMAVRDVFDPIAVQKYGLDWNYPEQVAHYADMTGFGEFWAQKYWQAHWVMPGFATSRQMLFLSDDFDLTDMDRLLRYADFPPGLVKPMIDAAFNPLTRVDVRRMHRVGTLSDEQLEDSYRRLGFNPENAKKMADFTIAYNAEDARSSTQTSILNAFKERFITEAEAINYLVEVDTSHSEAKQLVTSAAVERSLAEETERVKTVESQYVRGTITLGDAHIALAAYGYSGERISALLDGFQLAKTRTEMRPSRADLDRFRKANIISEVEYMNELTQLGYPAKYAAWYLQALGV